MAKPYPLIDEHLHGLVVAHLLLDVREVLSRMNLVLLFPLRVKLSWL